jgi:hypothetical protein
MGNKRREGLARKARQRYVQLTVPPPSLLDIQTDAAEVSLFLSLSRFKSLVSDIKRSIYRRPQHVWRQKTYDTYW